jgi:hypothetical protein
MLIALCEISVLLVFRYTGVSAKRCVHVALYQ